MPSHGRAQDHTGRGRRFGEVDVAGALRRWSRESTVALGPKGLGIAGVAPELEAHEAEARVVVFRDDADRVSLVPVRLARFRAQVLQK